jgi:hypothetical protein
LKKDRSPPDLVVREGDHGCRLRGNSGRTAIASHRLRRTGDNGRSRAGPRASGLELISIRRSGPTGRALARPSPFTAVRQECASARSRGGARKSRGVRSTERLSPPIALSLLPSRIPGQPGNLGRVGAHPAAAERYVFGRPDTLSSSAGSHSSTVASLAMISGPG